MALYKFYFDLIEKIRQRQAENTNNALLLLLLLLVGLGDRASKENDLGLDDQKQLLYIYCQIVQKVVIILDWRHSFVMREKSTS